MYMHMYRTLLSSIATCSTMNMKRSYMISLTCVCVALLDVRL